jgi:hypothetical protein
MHYAEVVKILNHQIFEGEKRNLIIRLAMNPERYTGVFRPTKPSTKLVQNLYQSREIRFGDALEYLIRELIQNIDYTNLNRNLLIDNSNYLSLDQYFCKNGHFYFVEQKIRDDHDSTKKHGQLKNFEVKTDALYVKHQNNLVAIMFFVDPALTKNKSFYTNKLNSLRDRYNIDIFLFYGHEFFEYLNCPNLWLQLNEWIKKWKTDLPDFPEIDFDISPTESFEEIKSIRSIYWRKLIENETIWRDGIIRVLFSDGTTLKLLFGYFSQQQKIEYRSLSKSLLERINTYYY